MWFYVVPGFDLYIMVPWFDLFCMYHVKQQAFDLVMISQKRAWFEFLELAKGLQK